MSEEPEKKTVTAETVINVLSRLRLRVSDFQENIETFLVSLEEISRSVKSRFASIEARLASLEVQLSMLGPSPDWEAKELEEMLNELESIGEDLTMMLQTWNSLTDGLRQRVN